MQKPIRFAFVGLLSLIGLGYGSTGDAAEPLPTPENLLKDYQTLGLPLPPKDARLVRYESGGRAIVNSKVQPKVYSLAFELKPATKTEKPLLLHGVYERQSGWEQAWKDEPEPAAIKDIKLDSEDALILAIHCRARGWNKLAARLLESSQKEDQSPPRKQLVQLAWVYWEDHLTKPKIDRAPVAKRLKDLIKQDTDLDTEYNQALLKSLDLALVPSKAKPGSVEALIDDLVDYNADTGTLGFFEPEARYWRIADLGFEAVPALIDHLGDERLTRAKMIGFNNFPTWHLRVQDVVSDLLEGLAGQDIGRDWLRRQQGYGVEKDEAKKWWNQARKVGEETYLLDHVLPAEGAKEGERNYVSMHLVHVILVKYPKYLPSLYKKVLDKRPEVNSLALAHALLRSKLPDKEKLELFLAAAKHKDFNHRLPAFDALKELDKKQFNSLLLETLDGLPKDVLGPYWLCPEARMAGLAMDCDDPQVWQTLAKVAKRSNLGLRVELLNHFSDPKDNRHRLERLRLLAGFLGDDALRDNSSSNKFDGPGAGFPYDKIEVRDFAALEIARLLGIDVDLKLDRTPEEWAKIRDQVQAALKGELSEMK